MIGRWLQFLAATETEKRDNAARCHVDDNDIDGVKLSVDRQDKSSAQPHGRDDTGGIRVFNE